MSQASERHARVSELFQAAAELPPQDRAAFLETRCDPSLRRQVELLLEADAQTFAFIEQPIAELPADLLEEEEDFAGRSFGAYRVIREIGRGGLGAVYLAARADEQFQKQVAIKVVKRGLDTDDILRRFRAERQILAQLEHPNIARLIDAGSTDEGLPYFVMEYVEGESITSYCDANKLSTTERLELFRLVCGASTYAHQHLVIHRDIKPSNILVTSDSESFRERGGVPKLLDFGIAKVLHADDPLAALTMTGVRVMTPEYASPEQVRGLPVSTATDVYSLGVLLYELLTGAKPYRLTSHTAEELSRAITDQIPERPSTTAIRNQRSEISPPKADQKSLRGDLDNIVLMALRKEPERRYTTVERFSEDIRRHLEGLPVSAHKDTFQYRATKFVRRNKTGVATALLVLLAVLGGIVATLSQARIAQTQRTKAERRFNDVRKLANSDLFEVYPIVENLEGSLKAREAILKNALTYLDSLAKEASGDPDLQSELATAYEKVGDVQGGLSTSNLGKIEAALDAYGRGRLLRASVLQQKPNDLEAKNRLANNCSIAARTLWHNNQTKEAEKIFEQGMKLRRELVAAKPDSVDYKNRLANLLVDYGAIPTFNAQTEKALALFNEALDIVRDLSKRDPKNTEFKKTRARVLRLYGPALGKSGDYMGGQAALEEALALSRELAREFSQDFRIQRSVWFTQSMICELMIDQGNGAEAVASCEGTIAYPQAILKKEPENGYVASDLATSHYDLARAYRLNKQFAQTIEQAQRAVAILSVLSAQSADNADNKRNLAVCHTEEAQAQIALGRTDEALALLEEVRATLRPIVAASPRELQYQNDLAIAQRLSARALHQKGDNAQAVELVDKAIAIYQHLRDLKAISDADQGTLAALENERAEYAR